MLSFTEASARHISFIFQVFVNFGFGLEALIGLTERLMNHSLTGPLIERIGECRRQCFDTVGWATGRASGL